MQIIYDSTGGRVPKFWRYVFVPLMYLSSRINRTRHSAGLRLEVSQRPICIAHYRFSHPLPVSDVDNRVRAIAEEVFGLTTVIWNQNSEGLYNSPPVRVIPSPLTRICNVKIGS